MEAVAKLIDSPSLLQEPQHNPQFGVLSSFLENVMIWNPRILEQVLQDVLLLDEHLHLVAVCLECGNGVLVVMKVGGMAQVNQDSHKTIFS